jgi:hypothetical protein
MVRRKGFYCLFALALSIAVGLTAILPVTYASAASYSGFSSSSSNALWGVDSVSFITPSFLRQIKGSYGTPQFIGRYLDAIAFSPMSASEASYIHSQGIRILPIQSDFGSDVGHGNGVSHAKDALAKAQALGIPKGTIIIDDIESNSAVDAGFIEGWYSTISGAGYAVGYYGNPYSGSSHFNSAFCAAVGNNPAIGNSMLHSTEPSTVRTGRDNAPLFAPAGMSCDGHTTGHTVVWQYGLAGGGSVNVDTDEAQSSVSFW